MCGIVGCAGERPAQEILLTVVAVVDEGDDEAAAVADHALRVPPAAPLLQALLAVVPLQLLAHAIATRRGLDVDRPRKLAKTVTVQ